MKPRKPRIFYGYIVAIAAFCVMMVGGGTFYAFGIFFKPLLAEFGWTRAMTSGAWSLCALLAGLLGIGMGRLSDRFGPRPVVTACGFFVGLGYLLMSQISAIWQLYLFYGVILAIGGSGIPVPIISVIPRWFVKRRGLVTGIVLSGMGVGIMVVPPLARHLISIYDWRTSYIIVGIVALISIMLAGQFLRRDPSQMGQVPYGEDEVKEPGLKPEAQGVSLRGVIHIKQFWMLCAILICHSFGVQAILVHIVSHATDLRISQTIAANILVFIGGLSIAGRVIMGSAGDRIGNKRAVTIVLILVTASLFWLLITKEVWMFFLFAAIFGFGYGGFAGLLSPIVAELFGLSSLGAILGGLFFGITIGGAIGPLLAGYIFDTAGSYNLAFLIYGIVSIIATVLTILLKPTRGGDCRYFSLTE